jgi:nuclease HARBI1
MIQYLYTFMTHSTYDLRRLPQAKLKEFASKIRRKGSPLQKCFGFIDGTVRAVCRPGLYQRSIYNGHKRVHSIKFQSVSTPDGIIIHLSGPWSGRRHDARMFKESGLPEILNENFEGYYLYGDPAYGCNNGVISPFRGCALTQNQMHFNRRMSSLRVSVEWCFGGKYEDINFNMF